MGTCQRFSGKYMNTQPNYTNEPSFDIYGFHRIPGNHQNRAQTIICDTFLGVYFHVFLIKNDKNSSFFSTLSFLSQLIHKKSK